MSQLLRRRHCRETALGTGRKRTALSTRSPHSVTALSGGRLSVLLIVIYLRHVHGVAVMCPYCPFAGVLVNWWGGFRSARWLVDWWSLLRRFRASSGGEMWHCLLGVILTK